MMKRNFLKKVMGTAMSAMLAGCMLLQQLLRL